jgi:serine/threonine protein phosphatase PrpC
VQFVGGTWRVGGLLALSRAFGDSYMKASGFNEGIADLGNDYSTQTRRTRHHITIPRRCTRLDPAVLLGSKRRALWGHALLGVPRPLSLSLSLSLAAIDGSVTGRLVSMRLPFSGSGFGVIADPEVTTVDVAAGDKGWLVVCSDGLIVNDERGGGGGLDNNKVRERKTTARVVPSVPTHWSQRLVSPTDRRRMCINQVASIISDAGAVDATTLAQMLAKAAIAAGSTDDITVVCIPMEDL